MLALRRALPAEDRSQQAARACARVVALPEFERAGRVAVHHAIGAELSVASVAAAALERGKPLLWPRVYRAGRIELAEGSAADLVPDCAGVLAPPTSHAPVALAAGDLIVIPGLAFTRDGARLGRGGGHYDRLLADARGVAITVGVAFDIQLVRELPWEPHDQRVDVVAMPSEIWRTK